MSDDGYRRAPFDQSIPELTEVLTDVQEPHAELVPAPVLFQPQQPQAIEQWQAPEPEPASAATRGEPDWETLEQRLTQRILQQLQRNIDQVIEQRMAEVLRHALQGVSGELRNSLHQSLEQLVTHAVHQEVGQLQASRL